MRKALWFAWICVAFADTIFVPFEKEPAKKISIAIIAVVFALLAIAIKEGHER